jgi:hypothetical protein
MCLDFLWMQLGAGREALIRLLAIEEAFRTSLKMEGRSNGGKSSPQKRFA